MLQIHGVVLDVLHKLRGHLCHHMRNVKPIVVGQKEWRVVYESVDGIGSAFQCLQPVVHLHLVGSIVDVVGMEERVQRGSSIHEIATHHSSHAEGRLHVFGEGTPQRIGGGIHPCFQRHCDLVPLFISLKHTYVGLSSNLISPFLRRFRRLLLFRGTLVHLHDHYTHERITDHHTLPSRSIASARDVGCTGRWEQ